MRDKTNRRLLSPARLMALALCFVIVFTLAFVFAEQIKLVNTDSNLAVADNEDDNEAKGGIASVVADQGELTADLFKGTNTGVVGFPGNANETKWTTTITFNNTVFGSNNVSNFLSSGDDNVGGVVGGSGTFRVTEFDSKGNEADHTFWYSPHLYSAVNYTFSEFMLRLITSSNYKVTATMTSSLKKINSTSSYNTIHFLLHAAKGKMKAMEKANENGECMDIDEDKSTVPWSSQSNSGGGKVTQFTTKSVEFVDEKQYLVMAWETQAGTSRNNYEISGISITFTITLDTSVEDSDSFTLTDGSAPIASSQYNLSNDNITGESGSTYSPYITSSNMATNTPVYFDSIQSKIKTDSVSNGNGKLESYRNSRIGRINGVDYYKYAQTEYVDSYNYSKASSMQQAITQYGADAGRYIGVGDRTLGGIDEKGNITWNATSDAAHMHYAAGIKSVKVNNTTFNMANGAESGVVKAIEAEVIEGKTETIGYAKVLYLNRSRVVVCLYMTGNGDVTTTVTDFGDLQNSTKIAVSGIDTEAPNDNLIVKNDYVSGKNDLSSVSGINWYRDKQIEADTEVSISATEQESAGYSPYIWFYTADRADKLSDFSSIPAQAYGSIADIRNARAGGGLLPIAIEELENFKYDFENGYAYAIGGAIARNYDYYVTKNESGEDVVHDTDAKGAGYYRFTFYVFDLAGNVGGTSTFYVKVDYAETDYEIKLSYKKGKNQVDIISDDVNNNGAWATGDITMTLKLKTNYIKANGEIVGFSGTTVKFDVNGTEYLLVIDGYGETDSAAGLSGFSPKWVKLVSKDTTAIDENTHTLKMNTSLGALDVVIAFDGATSTFTFRIAARDGENFAWISQFFTYVGQYGTTNEVSEDGHSNSAYGADGVRVLLDSTAPVTPIMSDDVGDEKEYLNELESYNQLPGNRVWFTSKLNSYAASIDFSDDIISSDEYADGLHVYYAFAVVKGLAALKGLSGLEDEIALKSIDELEKAGYFNMIVAQSGSDYSSDSNQFSIDLIASQEAGMRVFYVWAEDQAGNRSAINTYYVLADATQYKVSTSIAENKAAAKGSASLEVSEKTVQRGESIVFNIGLGDDYAPYKFSINDTAILENYTASKKWSVVESANSSLVSAGDFSESEYKSEITYVMDDIENLGKLSSKNTFELKYRRVVSYVTANRVSYSSQKADAAAVKAQTVFSDYNARDAFEVRFVQVDDINGVKLLYDKDGSATTDEVLVDGKPVYYAPTYPGSYKVALYIDKYNDTYVASDFRAGKDGNNIEEQRLNVLDYEIINGVVTISAIPSTSTYGKTIELDYTVSGIASKALLEAEHIQITLSLNVDGVFDKEANYAVGTYQIVPTVKYTASADRIYYDVVLESATHIVLQREIKIEAWGASKEYKAAEPQLLFGVNRTSLGETDAEIEEILGEVFAGYRYARSDGDYELYYADGRLERESGEAVQKYSYLNTASKFDVSSNYRVLLQRTNVFEITKRIVTLDVSGQMKVFENGTTLTDDLIATIVPSYKLASKDMPLAGEIDALINKLSVVYNDETGEYNVAIDTTDSDNLAIVLGSDIQYIIYIADPDTVIIRASSGASFWGYFGLVRGEGFTLGYSDACFDIIGTSKSVASVSWTAKLSTSETGLLGAGSYIVSFEGIELKDADNNAIGGVVVVAEPVVYTVKPAELVVKPTIAQSFKTYGDEDSAYGISFVIDTIAGLSVDEYTQIAGKSLEELTSISGAYARAIFDSKGNRISFATRYDGATKEGLIIGSNGRYYGIDVETAFASSSENFAVSAADDDTRLAINPKGIVLDTKYFVGISKYYDGSTEVNYGSSAIYDLTSLLVRASDKVSLSADAAYGSAGSPGALTETSISLSNITLTGDDAHNYAISAIENNGRGSSYVDGVVKIYYIDNSIGSGEAGVLITIYKGFIGLYKSDIIVSKQYDGTNELTASNISFKQASGTEILVNNKNITIENSENVAFSGSNVGTNYLVSTLVLFVPMDTTGLAKGSELYDVSIELLENGIRITVQNISASITKRVINASSFDAINAVDREYNKTTAVDMSFELSSAARDGYARQDNVTIRLKGIADSADVGTHTVSISEVSFSGKDKENYTYDLASINAGFTGIDVEISKAILVPSVTFDNKVYDGETTVTINGGKSVKDVSGTFTTTYADNLADELAKISFTGASFALSLNGKENANVIENAEQDGNPHNVLVTGMVVTITGDIESIAKNFKLAGSRYTDGKYIEITDVTEGSIPAYELIDATDVAKKEIQLIYNDFKVLDKVYDGTREATIVIETVGGNRFVEGHEKLLEIVAKGSFDSANAANNIGVTISGKVELQIKQGATIELGGRQLSGADVIGNYELSYDTKTPVSGNIKKRPVAVSVDLGEQVYNGQESVKTENSGFGYTLDGLCSARDNKKYAVNTAANAFYWDADVELVGDEVVAKRGTAYGLYLNSGNNNENYELVYTVSEPIEGKSLVAYITAAGDWVYSSTVSLEDTVEYYCYYLDTTSKYVYKENVDSVTNKDDIVGFRRVTIGGEDTDVYMLRDSSTATPNGTLEAVTYLVGYGKINKRVVSISAGSITIKNEAAFHKTYDGTTKFSGVRDVDYAVNKSAIKNAIQSDLAIAGGLEILDVAGEYTASSFGACYVSFTVSGIGGSRAFNYTYTTEGATQGVKQTASIEKRAITALLKDGEREYGANENESDITYSIGGTTLEKGLNNKYYMSLDSFLAIAGLDKSADEIYVKQLYTRTYNKNSSGEFVKADKDTQGEYIIILDGTQTMPTTNDGFGYSKPSVGTTSSYTLSGGSATNFKFVASYEEGDSATITIVPKTIYLLPVSGDFTKTYGSATPSVTILVRDKNNADGYVSTENWSTVFKSGSVDIGPSVKFGVLNKLTGELVSVDNRYARLSSGAGRAEWCLSENECYVFYLEAPQGVDYTSRIKNYNIVYAGMDSVKARGDGFVYDLTGDGAAFTKEVATLSITLPNMEGITVKDNTSNVFTYKYGVNWIDSVLQGQKNTDEIVFVTEDKDGNEVETAAINAGSYSGVIRAKRYIKVDDQDVNGFFIEWNSGSQMVELVVNRQEVKLRASDASCYYNGDEQSYPVDKLTYTDVVDAETGALKQLAKGKDYTLSYEVYDNAKGGYVATSSVKNAGKYRVTIAFASNFEENYPNYACGKSVSATLDILRAIVNVKLSTEGYGSSTDANGMNLVLWADWVEGNTYDISYSVAMDEKSPAKKVAVSKDDTTIQLTRNGLTLGMGDIAEAGKYAFKVVLGNEKLDENNYVINDGSGTLELRVATIDSSSNGSLGFDSSITVNRLEIREIVLGSTASGDDAYLRAVELQVQNASRLAGYEDDARVVAVYRIGLYCDNNLVEPTGNVQVAVAIPDAAKDMDGIVVYTVTRDGGLQKLTNYTIENGQLSYSADYVSGVVFVDTNAEPIEAWKLYTIIAAIAFVALVAVATAVGVIVRKAHLKKLELDD